MNEFDFIRRYLLKKIKAVDTILGIGDDAAIIRPQIDYDIHISSDLLLENRHFFKNTAPEDLAHKVLAVNLSDMAAMGATPRWVLLSVALPELEEQWLKRFCDSFFALADQFNVEVIGGDTTKGALTFNVTILGQTPRGKALKRDAAEVGDDIWVTGSLGLAAAALDHIWQKVVLPDAVFQECEQARLRPNPRVDFGKKLLTVAHAAQDISDGFAQDLSHILKASNVGACVWYEKVPTHPFLTQLTDNAQWPLNGGDDYELVFTAAPEQKDMIENMAQQTGTQVSRVGQIETQLGLRIFKQNNQPFYLHSLGFDHFDSDEN
ncbi:thiamine-phosphate kinase [Neisseria sp. Ec49-e6-T10]|uniref:thiamine-phosphate kinase n=1 Tax=Neisseria sp. Ec49-e6-T10 TaxID=3140744 RepID=UPI003EB8CAC0